MAQKVQVLLIDDVDGGEASETVSFALDRVDYEIDVSEANANALRQALAPWVSSARRVSGRGSARTSTATSSTRARGNGAGGTHDLAAVRAWARSNGFTVSDRGRVSREILAAFDQAH